MKFDWYLPLGSLFLIVFLVTRWIDSSFWNGLGVGFGLVSLLALGLGISNGLTKARNQKAHDETA